MKEEMTGKLKEMGNSLLEDDFIVKSNLPEEGDENDDYNRSVVEEYKSLASKLDDALKIHKAITVELDENYKAPAELLLGEHGPEDEEAECRRGFDAAIEVYMASFDRSKPPEEVALREAHEDAIQKAKAEFNSSAVGAGSVRQKYEKLLQSFVRKAFEDYKRNAYMEVELQCPNAIQNMEKKLRAACHASDASFDHVIKVLDGLVLEYEASCHDPWKWRKLSIFIRQGFEGPISDLVKRQIDQIKSEKSSLSLKCRSIEGRDRPAQRNSWKLVKSRNSSMLSVDSAKLESSEWKRKHEQVLFNHKRYEEQAGAEIAMLKSRYNAADARLDAAREQAKSAQEEAEEWK
ncbi:hypothetical protein Droror1_Dr00018168 [Drosera rotundifolia]